MWDAVAKKECPAVVVRNAALPAVVCNIVENQQFEQKALGYICGKQSEVPAAECETMLEKVWGMLVKKECPSKSLAEVADFPPIGCKLLKSDDARESVGDAGEEG